mmetsp:Transcript_100073/g.193208  ORF Transcript_100073/g.193208 Transcript_100073/m.193208 type:complete len:213 (+) Transcript_100073:44-682(+)
MFPRSSCELPTSWEGLVQAANTANEQLEFQVQKTRQVHDCFGKLLWASQMQTARLLEDQKKLRHMLHHVTWAQGHPYELKFPPNDMHPPWQRHFASPASELSEDEVEVALQELKEVFSLFIAANDGHETWRKLYPLLAKLPAPEPEIISGPGPEKVPLSQLQDFEEESTEASALPWQSPAAMRARLLPAPEFKYGAMTAEMPEASDFPENAQ